MLLIVNLWMHRDLKIDLFSAIQMLTGAWSDVSKETINDCFRKESVTVAEEEVPAEPLEDHDGENCDSGVHPVWAELYRFPRVVPDGLAAQEFVPVDYNVEVIAELNGHDNVVDVKRTLVQNDSERGGEDIPIPSAGEALAILNMLRRFSGNIEGSGLGALECVNKVGRAVATHIVKNAKQKRLAGFFK